MALSYNATQHREYLNLLDRVGGAWLKLFGGNTAFYNAAYWDLFTRIWREEKPVRKTDALRFMTGVKSAHTAGKYVGTAIEHGYMVEQNNPEDARSKLVGLSDDMRAKLDRFFDECVDELIRSEREIEKLGSADD
jgi:hypothetical protein